jgi:hypothetical protein
MSGLFEIETCEQAVVGIYRQHKIVIICPVTFKMDFICIKFNLIMVVK